jgi:hypothetical protein
MWGVNVTLIVFANLFAPVTANLFADSYKKVANHVFSFHFLRMNSQLLVRINSQIQLHVRLIKY